MTTNGNNKWFSISGIFRMIRGKPVVIQVIDKITNAVNKTKMMMAIFELHRKYFENVDFDTLFLDILDSLIPYPSLLYNTSYLEISAEIISDDYISDYKLEKILLNWIYNDPFFRSEIIAETPEAEIELLPPMVHAIMEP
uniref:Uncharacterized protein n=1 Tax=viral metagenome TaxID=1070528 RepID=A0A6C0HA17_9ZZZZ